MSAPASKDFLQALMGASPFIRHWGIEIADLSAQAQTLTLRMPWRPEAEGEAGTGLWHGGPIASLIDTAGCFAAILAGGRNAGTISLNVDYVRPAAGLHLDGTARVRKAGRTFSTVEVDVIDANGDLSAVGRGTFYLAAS